MHEIHRVLAGDKRICGRFDPVLRPAGDKAHGGSLGQQWERTALGIGQSAHRFVARHQRLPDLSAKFAPVVGKAPRGMGHGKIVSHRIVAGEVEVYKATDSVAQHQDIVREQVRMDDGAWQVLRPLFRDVLCLTDSGGEGRVDHRERLCAAIREHLCRNVRAQIIGAPRGKILRRQMHPRQHRADIAGLLRRGMVDRNSGQKFDQRDRLAIKVTPSSASSIMNGARYRSAMGG